MATGGGGEATYIRQHQGQQTGVMASSVSHNAHIRPGVNTASSKQTAAAGGSPGTSSKSDGTATATSSSLSIVFSSAWVRLTSPIGEGAFSRVYEGVYKNPETLEESVVAVKILKKNMLKRRSDCLRFIKEAKIMTKISHKHIAACYGIGKYEDDDPHNPGSLFIVQELIRGGNLLHKVYKQMLNRAKCVYTSQEALEWMIDVAEGMQYLHAVTETKPMIIHRDLKLENIMLAQEVTGVVGAKLVDFGLHKVIDDRIKKVVKRVISEANIGLRLARHRNQGHMVEEEMVDIDDELEAALAEQQALVEASSVRPGVGPAAASPLGGAGVVSPVAAHRMRQPPLRVTSRLTILEGVQQPSMSSMPEEADEEELAIQQAQAQQAKEREEAARKAAAEAGLQMGEAGQKPHSNGSAAGGGGGGSGGGGGAGAPTATATEGAAEAAAPAAAAVGGSSLLGQGGIAVQTAAGGGAGGGARVPLAAANAPVLAPPGEEGGAGHEVVVPALAKIRAPVKKQSSMQKLMAKMKEIRLRVTGATKDTPPAAASSMLSRSSPPTSPQAAATTTTTTTTAGTAGRTSSEQQQAQQQPTPPQQQQQQQPLNAHSSSASSPTKAGAEGRGSKRGGGVSFGATTVLAAPAHTSGAAAAAAREGGGRGSAGGPRGSQQQQQQQQQQGVRTEAEEALEARKARNVALLDQIVRQQSVAAGEAKSSVMDDLGLMEGAGAKKARAPPRRAVTMINEIRYNLTEAVGSWAYMAPEVVLGQPYNEKVDVFSFGVILFEVLNRKLMLVDEIKNDPRKDAQAYAERVARGFRPEIPRAWPEPLHELIAACWAQDPHCRPNFAAVVDALHEVNELGLVSKLDMRFMSRTNAFI